MELKERVAYLQGMIKGFEFEGNTKEQKVIIEILEVLGEMANRIQEIESNYEDVQEYLECMDEDLADVEEEIYGDELLDEDEDDEDYDEFDEYDADDDVCCEDVICPHCGEKIHICEEDTIELDEDESDDLSPSK